MCGICGFVGKENEDLIKKMTVILTHRGPDAEGYYTSDKVSFGHRRLAIIDLSEKGRQPILNEDKTVVLIFNGEIFNFLEIRKELIKDGHKFYSRTDTETIVHGYEEWGIKGIVEKLRGFFAFAIWDIKINTLFLVRDRIGVKPMYFFHEGKELYFASEIKSILENKKIKREVNEKAFWCYLSFQATLGDQTLFSNIKKLPPSTILTFNEGNISFEKYWELKKDENIASLRPEEKEERLKNLLLESVKLRLIADVPLGVLLSGGLDSSSIVSLMAQLTHKQIKTFSVGFGEVDDELKFARLVANKFETDHREIIINSNDIEKVLRKIVWHQDEPLADGGGIATYLTAQEVSQYVKVVLVGEGGDEIFGGYNWYRLGLPYFKVIPEKIRQEIYFYLTTFNRKKNDNKHFSDTGLDDFLSKMIKFEIDNILPNSLCMKVDKMTSAWGLEAREPFLDHKLAEFCFSLPVEDKIRFNSGKVLFRKVMRNMLPEEIVKRKKHGFLLPTERWLNGRLKGFAKENLLSKNSFVCKMYSRKELEDLFIKRKHLLEIERINLLWRLLIFELWYSIYF